MAKRNGVWKVFSIIGILLIAVLLCYFSVALYFYFGKPNDISSKLKVWNLMSDQSLGEIYLDASYRIAGDDITLYGVNIDEEGYVITLASQIDVEDNYILYSYSGKIYGGRVVFCDTYFNLAVIKMYDLKEEIKELSLPYVQIGDIYSSALSFNSTFVVTGDPLEENNILTVNEISIYPYIDYVTREVDGKTIVDFVNTSAYYYNVADYSNYSQGGIFNRKGELLGLIYNYNVMSSNTNNANVMVLDVSIIDYIIDDIKNSDNYSNALIENFNGFDMYELNCYLNCALDDYSPYCIYYNGSWVEVPEVVVDLYQTGVDGIYLMEDFVYNNTTISSGNFITSVNYNLMSYNIYTKMDLFYLFYFAESGETITITSQNLDTQEITRTRITVE